MKIHSRSISRQSWGVLSFTLALLPLALPARSDEALVELVRQKQESARALLDHCQMDYRVTFQHDNQEKGLHNTQTMQLEVRKFKQGDRMRLEVSELWTGENQFGEEGVRLGRYSNSTNKFLVVNENEEAHWSARDGEVSGELGIYRHASPKVMQRNADAHVQGTHGLDLVDFAFGFKSHLSGRPDEAAATYERLAELGTFDAQQIEQDGKNLIEVSYLRDGEALMTAIVDPGQGYATTSLTTHDSDQIAVAQIRIQYQISVREVADGVWAPETFRASESSSDDRRVIESSATAEVVALALNPVFDPVIFQWHALGYTGRYVHVQDEDGVGSLMVARGKELHPAPGTAGAKRMAQGDTQGPVEPVEAPTSAEESATAPSSRKNR